MNYLYHMIPENMKGNFLYPLHELKNKYPNLYKEEIKKYKGREEILKIKIPKLNCLWNDVLHLTSVNPKILKKELLKAGMKKDFKIKWFKINPKNLEKEKTIVYTYPENKKEWYKEKTFVKLKYSNLPKYGRIPTSTKKYFREQYSSGRNPLMFHLIPHILYKGKINIKDCETIEW